MSEAASRPTIATTTLSPARAGELYRVALTAFDGTEPYTWSAVGQPAWLILDASTGILSGTPTEEDAGEQEVWITVRDSSERPGTDVRGFRLEVEATPPEIVEVALPELTPPSRRRITRTQLAVIASLLVAGIALFLVLNRSNDNGSFSRSPSQTTTAQSSPTPTPGPSLAFGDAVTDELDPGQEHRWTFDGDAGQIVTIRVAQDGSASLRPSVSLLDPGGNDLGNACAPLSIVPSEARLPNKTLAFSGQHSIVVGSCSSSGGGYSLELSLGEPVTLTFGSTASGELAFPRDYEDWLFEGTEGDLVTITMTKEGPSSLDPILTLLDPGGNKLTSRYHCDGSFSEHTIEAHELPFTGTYTIRAEGCGSTTGAYSISLSRP